MELEKTAAKVSVHQTCNHDDTMATTLNPHTDTPLPEPLTQTMQAESVGNALEGNTTA